MLMSTRGFDSVPTRLKSCRATRAIRPNLLQNMKVCIENPLPGAPAFTSRNRARRFVRAGRAVFTITDRRIRFILEPMQTGLLALAAHCAESAKEAGNKRDTKGGYDRDQRSHIKDIRHLPIVQADKMIRQERSSRNWSYSTAVSRRRGSGTVLNNPLSNGKRREVAV